MKIKIVDIIMKILIFLTIALWILAMVYPEWFKIFIEYIKVIIESLWKWNYAIVFFSSLIEAFPVLGVVIPGQNILLIVGGFFWALGYSNLFYVIIFASIGAVIGNYVWYYLWKAYGDEFFKKYWLWFGIWLTEVKYLKKWIKKWGPSWIILWKFHSVTRAFLPFIAGWMWMEKKSFFIFNMLGSIIRACTLIILWVIFASYYKTIVDYAGYIFIWITILWWLYIYRFKKKEFMEFMEEKNRELDEKLK